MPKQLKKHPHNSKRVFIPKCVHEYIKKDGVTTCSKCDIKSIAYLNQLVLF